MKQLNNRSIHNQLHHAWFSQPGKPLIRRPLVFARGRLAKLARRIRGNWLLFVVILVILTLLWWFSPWHSPPADSPHPVDYTIRPVTSGKESFFENASAGLKTTFSDPSSSSAPALSAGEATLSVAPLVSLSDTRRRANLSMDLQIGKDRKTITAKQEKSSDGKDSIRYEDVFPGIDLTYEIISNGVKETVILKTPDALSHIPKEGFRFCLSLGGIIPRETNRTLEPEFIDPKTKQTVFRFLPAFMVDAAGTRSDNVKLTIEQCNNVTMKQCTNGYLATLSPDPVWLADPARVFPIAMDPTVKGNEAIAEWKLDEGYGTTTYDNSGNSNDLTITNATWERTGDTMDSRTTYVEFDGTTDYLSRAADTDVDFGTGSFSLTGWFKHNSTAALDIIMAHTGAVNGIGWKVYLDASGFLCFGIDDDATSFPEKTACTGSSQGSLADSKWHHFAAAKSGTSTITIYLDGNSITETDITGTTGTLTNSVTLHVGIDGDASNNAWTGFIDSIDIYNYALDATQVKADALTQGSPQIGTSFGQQTRDTLTDGLVGWWKLDESSGDAADSSGNAATLTNVSVTAYTGAKFGNGMEPDGIADYFQASDNASISITGSLTLAAWIQPDDTTSSQDIIAKWDGANESYLLAMEGANLRMYIDSSSNYQASTGTPITANAFQHVTGVYNAAAQTVKLYVNGAEVTSTTTGTIPSSIGDDGGRIHLGAEDSTGGAANFYDGHIDDARIYNRALSPAEVSQLYNWAPGQVVYYPLDENTGTASIADVSGNGNTATMNNIAASSWMPGKFGSSLDFDGSNDNISRADDADFDFTTSDNFTLESWIKTLTKSGGAAISFTNLGASSVSATNPDTRDDTNATSYANSSWTPPTSGIITVFVFNSIADCGNVPTMSGNSLTWTQIQTVCIDPGQADRITLFAANASGATTGVTTIDYNGETQLNTHTLFFQAEGVDISGGVSSAFIQSPTNSGTDTSGTITLSAAANSNNRPIAGFYHKANEATTPDASWTEIDDVNSSGPTFGAETQWDTDGFQNASASWTTSSAWIGMAAELKAATGQSHILAKYETTGADGGYKLLMEGDGDLTCGVDTDNSGFPLDSATSTAATYDDSNWHHIACVKNGSSTLKLYIDGVEIASDASLTASGTYANDDTLYIGIDGDGSSNPWSGLLDDMRVYNYARTPGQIVQDMNGGHPVGGSPVGSSVGYWKFDEATGTTAQDSSTATNDNDLTLSSASWTLSGKFGGAWNGTNAVWLSRADDADFDFAATEDLAVSGWFKSDSATNPGAIEYLVNKASATIAGYAVYANTSGQLCFGIDDDTTWGPDIASCTSADFYDAAWHHVAAVRDSSGTDKTYIYIDGIERDSDSDTTTATLANSLSLYVGDRDGTDNGDEFAGDIDEVKIYRAALTADQVKVEYNRGKSVVLGSTHVDATGTPSNATEKEFCIAGDTNTCDPPVAWYKMDDNTGTTTIDSSSNGGTGTFYELSTANAKGPDWILGKVGTALTFDKNEDVVRITENTATTDLGNADSYTVSAWFTTTETDSGTDCIVCKDDGTGLFPFRLIVSNKLAAFTISDGTNSPSTTGGNNLNDNRWHFMVGVRDVSADKLYVYADAVLLASTTDTTINSIVNNDDDIAIGNGRNSTYTLADFLGSIDDVRIYNYARTPAQIAWDYNRGAPVGWWKLDECTGTTAYDSSKNANGDTNGNTGTITIGASGGNTSAGTCTTVDTATAWYNGATGKRNASLDFDGTDDIVTVTDTANLRFDAATQDFTIFAWVKRTTTGTEYILSKEDADNDGWRLMFNSSNQVLCSEDATDVTSTSTITDTNWHNVGCTIDRDGNGQVYIDGKPDGSATSMGSDAMATTTNMLIGARSYTTTSYINGQIDDIRIYNYALTATQVKTVMNDGATRFGPDTGSP